MILFFSVELISWLYSLACFLTAIFSPKCCNICHMPIRNIFRPQNHICSISSWRHFLPTFCLPTACMLVFPRRALCLFSWGVCVKSPGISHHCSLVLDPLCPRFYFPLSCYTPLFTWSTFSWKKAHGQKFYQDLASMKLLIFDKV